MTDVMEIAVEVYKQILSSINKSVIIFNIMNVVKNILSCYMILRLIDNNFNTSKNVLWLPPCKKIIDI